MRRRMIGLAVGLALLVGADAVWAQGIPGVPKVGIPDVGHKSKRPPGFCGNGFREPGEQCDGGDAPGCPGTCLSNCTCPGTSCGGSAAPACGGSCPANSVCQSRYAPSDYDK